MQPQIATLYRVRHQKLICATWLYKPFFSKNNFPDSPQKIFPEIVTADDPSLVTRAGEHDRISRRAVPGYRWSCRSRCA